MSGNKINPNSNFDSSLLQNADAADGNQDATIDLQSPETQQALQNAGVDDLNALDKWDGKQDGQLDLMKVRNPNGPLPARRSSRTYFQNRTDDQSRSRVYDAVLEARAPEAERQLALSLEQIATWSSMSRRQYNSFFDSRSGYEQSSNHLTQQLENLRSLRAESSDPNLNRAVDAYVTFFEHVNGATAYRPTSREQEATAALELLTDVESSLAQLSPEHRQLRDSLTPQVESFKTLLANFTQVATLAESRSGQIVNSADNQLAPYLVKTFFRHAEDLRRDTPRHDGTIEGAINSYQADIRIQNLWTRRLADVRANRSEYSNLQEYQAAMENAVSGASEGMRNAARKMAESEWRSGIARSHLERADTAIQSGQDQVAQANTHLNTTQTSLRTAETLVWRGERSLTNGDTGQARQHANAVLSELGSVETQLQAARARLQNADSSASSANLHLQEAGRQITQSTTARQTVENGTYSRRFQGELAQLRADITQLETLKSSLQQQHSTLIRSIETSRSRETNLSQGVGGAQTSASQQLTRAQQTEREQAEQAYSRALDNMRVGDTLVLAESGLAALIRAAADENGESARVDFRVGAGVAARFNAGVVGGRVWLQGMISSGVSVRRGDSDSVEVAIDFQAMVNAGVEVEALFGLVGTGVEGTIDYEHRKALRFANAEDAARFLMQNVYAPIIAQARSQCPSRARGEFDTIVRTGRYSREAIANPVYEIKSNSIRSTVALRASTRLPGILSARARGGLTASVTHTRFTNEVTGAEQTGTTRVQGGFFEFGSELNGVGEFNVRGQVSWKQTQGDVNNYNNGQDRDWDLNISLEGNAAKEIIRRGQPAITEFAGEILGIRAPYGPDEITAAGVTSQVFEGVQTALTSQLAAAPAANSQIALQINIHEQNLSAPDEEPNYEVQFTRVSLTYDTFAGVGRGMLSDGGGDLAPSPAAINVEVTAGVNFQRTEVIGEIVASGTRAGENYILQNAGSHETHLGFNRWARQHSSATTHAFTSAHFSDNVPANSQINIDGQSWNADRINEFRANVASGGVSPSEFRTITSVMYQLERQRIGQDASQ